MLEKEDNETHIAIFSGKKIRRKLIDNKWYFSIVDILIVLTNSTIPRRYWSDLKIKLKKEGFESYDKIVQLKLIAEDGKFRETDCADTEGIFRIIQSIPSKKAELFKRWLARVGYERVQNPNTYNEHLEVSNKGGNIAKNARNELEQEIGEPVVSEENYLLSDEKIKRKKRKLINSFN